MVSRPCHQCEAETTIRTIDTGEGCDEPLRLAIRSLPVAVCGEGHRQLVHPAFAAELLDHLTEKDEPELPSGEEKGLIRKHYQCEDCGAALEAREDHRHTFVVTVDLRDLDPFEVELTLPVYACSDCGKVQVHSLKEIRRHTPAALAHAFQSADIPPG